MPRDTINDNPYAAKDAVSEFKLREYEAEEKRHEEIEEIRKNFFGNTEDLMLIRDEQTGNEWAAYEKILKEELALITPETLASRLVTHLLKTKGAQELAEQIWEEKHS